jgi:gliding motility-associated-like protein
MHQRLLTLILLIAAPFGLFAQCEVQAFIYEDTIVCGQCVTLYAAGEGQGQQVFSETFNNGQANGWAYTNQAQFNNPCSPNGVDGTTHIWMGNNTGVPRVLQTLPYDFSQAVAGVTVCFDLLFAPQTGDAATAPCEGPDEPDEGVLLQYSIDGGNTWVDIHYFDPNGGSDPQLINWNNWCFTLPPAALTTSTVLRWFQDNDSGADYDHWGLDNVEIYFNDPTYQLFWQHDNYIHPPGEFAGFNPTQVCPTTTTTYWVGMANGNFLCIDSVVVYVRNPSVRIHAGVDTSVCPGQCVDLQGQADILVSAAKTPTYFNGELQPIANAFGSETAISINITDLNMNTVLPGSITGVCIQQLFYFGTTFFPVPGQTDIGDLNVYLQCPDGTRITLVPAGATTGTNNPLTGGYLNTCFVPAGPAIGLGQAPYSGSWSPAQPFDDLVGCTANGLWQIVVSSNTLLGFGAGTFFGWSISFDDPEISYPANFAWLPSASLSDTAILNPTACPLATTQYTLFATDTAGCVSASDSVRVAIGPDCCPYWFAPTVSAPACAGNNGSISVALTGGSGNFAFLWNTGATISELTGLNGGTFTVSVTDLILNCTKDTTFVLPAPNLPQASIVATDATCSQWAALDLSVTNGSGNYVFVWDNGQTTEDLNGLSPGNYAITVTDLNGNCTTTASATVLQAETELLLEIIANDDTDCGPTCNGFATISLQNGAPPFDFVWNNGATSGILAELCSGVYLATVTNPYGCSASTSISVDEVNAVSATLGSNAPICAGETLTLEAMAPAGSVFAWTGPAGFVGSNATETLNNAQTVNAGVYTVTATDANGCTGSADFNVQVIALDLEISNGPIDTVFSGGQLLLEATSPLDPNVVYTWTAADGFQQTGASVEASPSQSTLYTVVAILGACSESDSLFVIVRNGALALPNAFTPNGDGKNDRFFPLISGDVEVQEFRVFNRWGQTVHHSNVPWDGGYQENAQPRDVYFYHLRVLSENGEEQTLIGEVTLIR